MGKKYSMKTTAVISVGTLLVFSLFDYSELNGIDLVRKKVLRWVAMGGKLPG